MNTAVMSSEAMEGRLNAHRELMIDFVAALLGGQGSIQAFAHRLSEDSSFNDHEEDPGVIPSEAFAIEQSAAHEIRTILEAARARAAAQNRTI